MKIRICLLGILLCASLIRASYALEWKKPHEEADKKNLQEVLLVAQLQPRSAEDLYVLGLVCLNLHKDK